MKEIEELLEDIIESSKVATLRFPRNGIEAQKVLTIKAEILCRFAELENYKSSVDNTPFGHWKQRAEAAEAKLKEKELTSICAYCGTKLISKSIDTKMNDVIEHMAECKKHPVPSMLDKLLEIEQWFLQHREHSLEIWNGYATLHNNGMFTLSQSDDKTAEAIHD